MSQRDTIDSSHLPTTESIDETRRKRILLGANLVILLNSLSSVIMFTGMPWASPVWLTPAIGVVGTGLSFGVFFWTKDVRRASIVTCVIMALFFVPVLYPLGGLHSRSAYWFGLLPSLTLFLLGRKWALWISTLLLVGICGIWLAPHIGFTIPPAKHIAHDAMFTILLAFFSLAIAIGWLFESSRQKAIESLTLSMQQTQQMALEKEAAELANQTKSEFLATMSHELRTPLNAILGYTEILEEEAESDELDHYLEDLQKIRAAGSHLLTMINDVLQLSRMEAGKIDLEPESLSMRSFLTDIVEELGALIRSKENDIDLVCNEATIWFVDAFRLKQIVINLLNNANKFTEKGTITICVEDVQEDGQTWHQLSVKDTGIGMSPDETQRIFEKFTQADASTTRKYGGTGLGLTICKKLAERMDGYITVQSQKGEGSVFSLYLAVTNECEPSSL